MKNFLIAFLTLGLWSFTSSQEAEWDSPVRLLISPYDEQNPMIAPDGNTLYFTISNHPQNTGGVRDPGDIWFSTWTGSQWSAPVHGGPLLNDRGYNGVAGFAGDGQRIYLLGHYDASGVAQTQGISRSIKTTEGWARPENISIPYFQNKSSFHSGYVTPDGKIFIYSAETYGSYGVDDLYVTLRDDKGKWSEPKNLGPVINTQFQELAPSLSADGKTLYFSSNGRKGYGSFDIYSSQRLDDSFTRWSEPVNLGPEVNSEGRELFYRDFEHLNLSVFTSTKNSDGYGDIKFVHRKSDAELPVVMLETKPSTLPEPSVNRVEPDDQSVRVYGRVLNARNNAPIRSRISFTTPDNSRIAESTPEGFTIIVPKKNQYNIEIKAEGYISTLEKIDLQSFEMNELELQFSLHPIEVGTTVNLKSVLFIQSKPELLSESYPELNVVVAFMKANPNVSIELAGHTDNRGSFRQLMELSQKRVNRVKDYMVSQGIDKKRITGKGYGGSKPVATNETEEGRILNRRVEFIIKKF
jgi:OmpA-OmpF porin, OOP family